MFWKGLYSLISIILVVFPMKNIKALLVVALAFGIITLFSMPQVTEHQSVWKGGPIGEADAVNNTVLQEGINESIEDYVPLIVAFSLLGIALAALGINMYVKR